LLTKRIEVVNQFVDARKLEETDANKMVEICLELVDLENADAYIRVGDVFSQIIEYYYQCKDYRNAYV